MDAQIVTARLQIRRDSSATWAAKNPILLSGELGLESDTLKIKVGDGTTAWGLLEYIKGEPGKDGAAATIKIGTVKTGSAGSEASVSNSGTENNAVLNFVIPKGATGPAGSSSGSGGSGITIIKGVQIPAAQARTEFVYNNNALKWNSNVLIQPSAYSSSDNGKAFFSSQLYRSTGGDKSVTIKAAGTVPDCGIIVDLWIM